MIRSIKRVLIPNRGEIALRIIKACRDLNITSVIAHSVIDELSMPVRIADESICIGDSPAKSSYLNMSAIITAAHIMQCDAIHPGIGFLSENSEFARLVEDHGIIFIGPSATHLELLGHKTNAKITAQEIGLPVVPGSGIITSLDDAKQYIEQIGYPILIKAVGGGGGKGIRAVYSESELSEAYTMAKAECKGLASDGLYIEKLLIHPRHIEFQVLGDQYGNVICLGDRDCSVQRRHQKIWEEAPASILTTEERINMIQLIVKAMKTLKYVNAGTLEFLYKDGHFYFIEMNTRLQIEHTITEMITCIDIVHEQIRIASGEKLSVTQDEIQFNGVAIECRINAEHPNTFIPSVGKIEVHIPSHGPGIRLDTFLYPGYVVPHYYDSMTGKLIVWAKTRDIALRRLSGALKDYVIIGIDTLIPLFKYLCIHQDIINNKFHINWLEAILSTEIIPSA